jgi:hypothetical protein
MFLFLFFNTWKVNDLHSQCIWHHHPSPNNIPTFDQKSAESLQRNPYYVLWQITSRKMYIRLCYLRMEMIYDPFHNYLDDVSHEREREREREREMMISSYSIFSFMCMFCRSLLKVNDLHSQCIWHHHPSPNNIPTFDQKSAENLQRNPYYVLWQITSRKIYIRLWVIVLFVLLSVHYIFDGNLEVLTI